MTSEKKTAIVLAGSGVFDGSEIHEATMTMYAVMKLGGSYQLFAPDKNQHHVVNHITGAEMPETRNVLVESARIARGNIKILDELDMTNFDALMFPGGFGVAKNLCDLAFKGPKCTVDKGVERVVKQAVELSKPIGALCISPAMIARILPGAKVTVGQDEATITAIEKMGSTHRSTNHGEVCVDANFKIASTPCYMLDANILHIADGALNVTRAVFEMIGK